MRDQDEIVINVVVEALLDMMKKGDGTEHNFVGFRVARTETGEEYDLQLQRVSGLTPLEKYTRLMRCIRAIVGRFDADIDNVQTLIDSLKNLIEDQDSKYDGHFEHD